MVRHAIAAVEGDSVAVLEGRWGRAAARTPPDRSAVLGLATLARLTYRYERAESLYTSLDPGAGTPDAAAVYALLGQGAAGRTRGAQRVATDRFERAWAAAELAGDRDALTEALIMLAVTRVRTVGPVAAESLFQRAAAQTGRDPQLQALYHCTHAELLALSFRPAGEEAARGAELAAQAGDGRLEAACNHFVAADLGRRGGIWWAAGRFQRVITQRRLLRDRAGLATSLQWRGYMLRSSGWLEDARRDLEESVSEGQASGNASAQAWALNNLAAMSLVVGDASAAARYADSSAALFAEQGDRYGEAQVIGMRGGIAAAAGDLEGAARGYRASLALAEQIGDRAAIVVIRTILAQHAMRRRDWPEAGRELEAAREVATAGGMLGRLNALQYHQGVLALHTGQFAAAERDLRKGLIRVGPSATDDGQWDWYYFYAMRLAELYAGRGELQRAESLAQASMQALDTWRSALSQRELRLQAYQVSEDNADPDLGLATVIATLAAAGRVEPAFHLAERLRARELLDHLARAEGLATADSTRERTAQSSSLGTAATRAEIAAALPDAQTALLEFVTGRGGEPTTVFVLTRDTLHAHVVAPVDSLEPLIDRLTSLLESGAEPRELARTLGARLLDSVLATLPAGITRLVMIPDGALHRVPFDALITADDRFVVQRYAVGIVPSATVAARLWNAPRHAGPSRVLALADPALRGAGGTGDTRSAAAEISALPRLRASRREARLVARYADGSTVRLGEQASEAWLKQTALPHYRVLHFATHARADEATLSGTAIALTPGQGEDGLVGPGELGRLQLDADLVVLSACRSGGGVVVRGEGIVGLAAPLIEAGARAVALTRWAIGDEETVSFIAGLYDALATGQPVADALRDAKIAAIARGASPAQWAAFTIVGDPTITVSLTAPRPGVPLYWWIGGAAALLLLAGWARRRFV